MSTYRKGRRDTGDEANLQWTNKDNYWPDSRGTGLITLSNSIIKICICINIRGLAVTWLPDTAAEGVKQEADQAETSSELAVSPDDWRLSVVEGKTSRFSDPYLNDSAFRGDLVLRPARITGGGKKLEENYAYIRLFGKSRQSLMDASMSPRSMDVILKSARPLRLASEREQRSIA